MSKFDAVAAFETYLRELRKTPLDEHTEHTGRSALEALLNGFVDVFAKGIVVQHEPKRAQGKGAPDFKLSKTGSILGYVETKGIGENLDAVLKSDQIKKYKTLSGNILLTDYLHWVWITESGIKRETLCFATDLESPRFHVRAEKAEAVATLIEGFLSTAPEGIGRAQTLAIALATRSQLLRDFLGEELVRQEREHREGRLFGLYEVFKDQVFHDLTLDEFADAFAQMLAYGLFLSRLNSGHHKVTLHNARQYVPGSFRLIRELVQFLDELNSVEYADIRWVVEEILSIVNGLDLTAIHEDLSFRHRKVRKGVKARDEEEARLFERDPFVYFYEDFLAKYDAKMKKARGVYYTPPPIVNFIVRAINGILKETFGIKSGLADHKKVTVLDFACGTGTFLVEILQQIFDQVGSDSGKRDLVIREHILKNLYGFEYLLAPYTIAHLKLSQYLVDKNYKLADDERLQIFLTNTLEPIEPQRNFMLPALTAETKDAQKVKDEAILVITGNPPYSGESRNPSEREVIEEGRKKTREGKYIPSGILRKNKQKTFIGKLIETYKFVDGAPLGERNPRWLQDDYVKFIRFAQWKMDAVEEGIVGVITNHSYLQNATFRGMRQSLMNSFDQVWVFDLHGSSRNREEAPNGEEDQNVFDIEQGVAIAFFVKRKGVDKGVWHAEAWGRRLEKYQLAAEIEKSELGWERLEPKSPHYLFVPQNRALRDKYQSEWSVQAMWEVGSVGLLTARDSLTVQFSKGKAMEVVRDFASLDSEAARSKYHLGKDVRDWRVEWAQKDLIDSGPTSKHLIDLAYRPFDIRATYYTGRSRGFHCYPRDEVMHHMLRPNISLLTARSNKSSVPDHFFCADIPSEAKCAESTVQSYTFPLYTYLKTEEVRGADLFAASAISTEDRKENFSPKFRDWLDGRYSHHFKPEEIFGAIYAVLNAPTYRRKYADFLRVDFPHVPFPTKVHDFRVLSKLGWELAQVHLMKQIPELDFGRYRGRGGHEVERVRYHDIEEAVYINDSQKFVHVPNDVWNFHVGGYQIIDKYLKSRRGCTLSLDEIEHVERVANALAFSIEQMEKIDEAYRMAFGG